MTKKYFMMFACALMGYMANAQDVITKEFNPLPYKVTIHTWPDFTEMSGLTMGLMYGLNTTFSHFGLLEPPRQNTLTACYLFKGGHSIKTDIGVARYERGGGYGDLVAELTGQFAVKSWNSQSKTVIILSGDHFSGWHKFGPRITQTKQISIVGGVFQSHLEEAGARIGLSLSRHGAFQYIQNGVIAPSLIRSNDWTLYVTCAGFSPILGNTLGVEFEYSYRQRGMKNQVVPVSGWEKYLLFTETKLIFGYKPDYYGTGPANYVGYRIGLGSLYSSIKS